MMKKLLKNTDVLFVIMMSAVMLLHIYFIFCIPGYDDESQYVSIPFRIINGDRLVQHEWHLTQFSSLFSYLPVRIWTWIKGSADGIFIFLRCVYLTIHTTLAVLIYRFFREHGKWAVLASIIFFIQVPYGIQAISYHSMFATFLLLFTLCLVWIYNKQTEKAYILAGVCYGCCCICNPLCCLAFAFYLIICALWTKKGDIKGNIFKTKHLNKEKKLTNREKREQKKQALMIPEKSGGYDCFFNKEAVVKTTCGISIIAIIAICYFLLTGGKISSIFDNINNLLGSSEYDVGILASFSKIFGIIKYFTIANLGMPWILPLVFILMKFDKKRKNTSHRNAYLGVTVLWMMVFVIGVLTKTEVYLCALSLPFSMFSLVCYMLTEKKNKVLFNCMYAPCLIASIIHCLAADTLLASIGIVLAISNISGMLFVKDLWNEMHITAEGDSEATDNKKTKPLRSIIVVAFCIQVIFYTVFYQCGNYYEIGSPKVTTGPYAGLCMSQSQYDLYNSEISDLNIIKEISSENDPVLIGSFRIWMYLHLDRPFATYTTWYRGGFDMEKMRSYYKANPERRPKYIYVETLDSDSATVRLAKEIADEIGGYTERQLSCGVLLSVHGY